MVRSDLPAILGGLPVRPAGPPAWPPLSSEIEQALHAAWRDGSWNRYLGPHVPALVQRLAAFHGVEFVIPCASGTAAVELALRGLRIGPGDEVLMSAYDFKSNFQNVLAVGALPRLVDVVPDGWWLDASNLEQATSPHVKAILVSHLHGRCIDMPAVVQWARSHGLAVIEDAAQMPGAQVRGRPVASWGDVGVLSFGGSKLVGAGRGGAILTSRADVAQHIRLYTQRGNEAYPLSELQALVLVPQWEGLQLAHAQRTAFVADLLGRLDQQPGLRGRPETLPETQPAYYKVGLWYNGAAFADLSRDVFAASLRAEGIACDPGWRGLHRIHASRRFVTTGPLEAATALDQHLVTLHHPVLLEPHFAIDEIVTAVDKVRTHAAEIARAAPAAAQAGLGSLETNAG